MAPMVMGYGFDYPYGNNELINGTPDTPVADGWLYFPGISANTIRYNIFTKSVQAIDGILGGYYSAARSGQWIYFASGSGSEGRCKRYNVDTGEVENIEDQTSGEVLDGSYFTVSATGDLVFFGASYNTTNPSKVYNTTTGQIATIEDPATGNVVGSSITSILSSGDWVYFPTWDTTPTKRYNIRTGAVESLDTLGGGLFCCTVKDNWIYFIGNTGKRYNETTGAVEQYLPGPYGSGLGGRFRSSVAVGDWIYLNGWNGDSMRYNMTTGDFENLGIGDGYNGAVAVGDMVYFAGLNDYNAIYNTITGTAETVNDNGVMPWGFSFL